MIMQSHRDQRAAELQKKVSHGPRQEEHTSSIFHELYKIVESHDLSKTVPSHERCLLSFIAGSGIGDEGNTRLLVETIVL